MTYAVLFLRIFDDYNNDIISELYIFNELLGVIIYQQLYNVHFL